MGQPYLHNFGNPWHCWHHDDVYVVEDRIVLVAELAEEVMRLPVKLLQYD